MRWHVVLGFAACVIAVHGGQARSAGGGKPPATVVLDTGSFWRFRTTWETVEVVLRSGEVGPYRFAYDGNWFRKHAGEVEVAKGDYKTVRAPVVRLPERTSRDWMAPDFDDSSWVRLRGPMLAGSKSVHWKLILMRGRFEVTDPAKAGDLGLSLTFRGGAVVYLNGQEVSRAFMPKGEVRPHTPALPYPEEVYLDDRGYLVWPHDDRAVYQDRVRKRVRRITGLRIPSSMLRKGVNVLAISLQRAPAPELLYIRRIKRYPQGDERMHWCKTGLIDVKLTAPAGSSVMPNTSAPKGRGVLVWNHSIVRKVFLEDYPDPFAPLRPVQLSLPGRLWWATRSRSRACGPSRRI